MNNRRTISAAMIVRNEEENLPRCLKSIRDHVDEIIIVDTGSEDGTIEIAKSFGVRLFEHPWEDDFSKHRNQSIGYAAGDWILIIDADEELSMGDIPSLKEALKEGRDTDSILISVESRGQGGHRSIHNSIRIFKNIPEIRYEGRVHNELAGMRTGIYMPLRILHHGYALDRETQKKKFERTVKLLLLDVKDDPGNPRAHHYLGISYLSMNMYNEALRESERAIELCGTKNIKSDLYSGSYYVAATSCMRLGDMDRAESLALEALKHYPSDLDSLFVLSKIYFEKKNMRLFFKHAANYLERVSQLDRTGEGFGTSIFQTAGFKWLGHLYRGCAWLDLGNDEKGRKELGRALVCCPDKAGYHHLLAGYYRRKRDFESSEIEFKKALEQSPDRSEILWDYSQFHKERDRSQDSEDLLKSLIDIRPDHKNALFELGNINLNNNNFKKSIYFYERLISLDKEHAGARLNMALSLRKLGRFDESIHQSMEALKKYPESLEAHSNLAFSYYSLGDYEKALESFFKISRLDPDRPDAYVYLSQIHLIRGDVESCVKSCDNLLRILNLKRDIVLKSLKDLGELFLVISNSLNSHNKPHLSRVCLDMGRLLSRNRPVS